MSSCREDSLGRQIYFTSQEMSNFAEKVLKPFDLTLEQFHLLKNMPVDSGITQREIGEISGKTAANMTRMLDRMEAKDLVIRRENPEDRRASLVFLTDKGRALVEEVFEGFESFSAKFVQGVSEKEQQIVRSALMKMTENIQKMSEELDNKSK